MEQKNVSKRVKATILSMSLLTVMAGAAIAPALGIIKAHFASAPDLLVQLIVSMPALLIIITNIFFLQLVRRVRTRTIATIGLLLYVAAGAGCFFVDEIHVLLLMRALLGVSVGLIMPLSTGLLAYYFPPERQARLMGLSAAMNQMGGVIATLLAGLLATIQCDCHVAGWPACDNTMELCFPGLSDRLDCSGDGLAMAARCAVRLI